MSGSSSEVVEMINTLGFPVFMAVIMICGIYIMMRWMMKTLMDKIGALWNMTVKLIDRVRALDNSVIRLETMIRVMKELDPDWERLGKVDAEDKRKD